MLRSRISIALLSVLVVFAVIDGSAFARSPVKLRGGGEVASSAESPSTFVLEGTASHLGKYIAYGEVEFAPGADEGTAVGLGVVVIEAANGDLIVGNVLWELAADGTGSVGFVWQDSIALSDGTVISNTGRFVSSRPPGAFSFFTFRPLTFNIIAILIG